MRHTLTTSLLLSAILIGNVAGCTGALVVGGAAAGASIAHDRRTAGTIVEDQSIEMKANYELAHDAELAGNGHINVTSYNNAVLLSGEVSDARLRQRAEDIVSRIDKVRHVHNELTVSPPSSFASRSTDTWITTKVKSALLRVDGLEGFDPTRVKVVTERGVVYLFGLLRPQEADAVTNAARRISGVQKVVLLFEYIEPAGQTLQASARPPT